MRVPFPYADRNAVAHRPAVVVATRLGLDSTLVWVVMITAAENRRWPGDIEIADHLAAGLPIPSVIRPSKIATIVARRAERRGRVAETEMAAVETEISAQLLLGRALGVHE